MVPRLLVVSMSVLAGVASAQQTPSAAPQLSGPAAQWRELPPPPPPPPQHQQQQQAPAQEAAPPTGASAETFETVLAPYGQWFTVPGLGRVWQPYPEQVGADFVPYSTNGGWRSTVEGWSFESAYPWGPTVFHYGRWYLDDELGWLWWPASEWAPAWVEWRTAGDYAAWAPLPPPGHSITFSSGPTGWSFAHRDALGQRFVSPHQLVPHWNGHATTWSHHSHHEGVVGHREAHGHLSSHGWSDGHSAGRGYGYARTHGTFEHSSHGGGHTGGHGYGHGSPHGNVGHSTSHGSNHHGGHH